MIGEEADECFVGGAIHGRGGNFDAQLVAERFANFVRGRAGLEFDRE